MLNIKNLEATIDNKHILRGLNLDIKQGEVHAIMGPNGSGKSTLAKAIAGHGDYEVTNGSITLNGEELLEMDPDERARKEKRAKQQRCTKIKSDGTRCKVMTNKPKTRCHYHD